MHETPHRPTPIPETTNTEGETTEADKDSSPESEEDEAAYKQAMLDYEYDKQQYNKMVADINAKTEIIHQEDRKKIEVSIPEYFWINP